MTAWSVALLFFALDGSSMDLSRDKKEYPDRATCEEDHQIKAGQYIQAPTVKETARIVVPVCFPLELPR